MHYIGVRDGKKEKDKKANEILASWFTFTQYTLTLCRCIHNLKTVALIGAEKSATKIFIVEKDELSEDNAARRKGLIG